MATNCFKFEELLPYFGLDGTCEVFEQTPPGGAPTQIIRIDQAWGVQFKWDTTGPLNYIMAGKWCLRILLEEMGCGEFCLEEGLAKAEVDFMCEPRHHDYKFNLPGGKVKPGVYKLVATITMVGPSGIPGPIAGFCEGQMLQFYDGGPIR